MKYKVGDYVIIIGDYKDWYCIKKYRKGKDLKNAIGKIKSGGNLVYRIEIINCPYKNKCECYVYKQDSHCWSWYEKEIKSLDSLKLKKFIEHGV